MLFELQPITRVKLNEDAIINILEKEKLEFTDIDFDVTNDGTRALILIYLRPYFIEILERVDRVLKEFKNTSHVYDAQYTTVDQPTPSKYMNICIVVTADGLLYNENEEAWK